MESAQLGISTLFQLILDFGLLGLPFRDTLSVLGHCHPVISSCCADISEAKTILALLYETRLKLPCHRFTVSRSELHLPCSTLTPRTQHENLSARQYHPALPHDLHQALLEQKPKLAHTSKQQAHDALQDLSLAK